ncbi:MAG: FAD-dependent oxidoreductase [Clostridiales bacterium]|nr:FAD-dependent oxidoreductase [Clostridiales bacterium]
MYDIIVIGAGAAGLSGAIYTSRACLKTLVLGGDDSNLAKANVIDNYFGFSESVGGQELLNNGIIQAQKFGTEFVKDEVLGIGLIELEKPTFEIFTAITAYRCHAVLITTGSPLPQVKIPGIKDFEGRGVSYCVSCDGFFYRNAAVGVLGNRDYAFYEAFELESFTSGITIYTNGEPLILSGDIAERSKRYRIVDKRILSLTGGELLSKINFEDGTSENISGLFVATERPSGIDFAKKLGVYLEDNRIVTDKNQKTNLKGIYAAGDCASEFKQVSVAVGQGAIAAHEIIQNIKHMKKDET